MSPEEKVRLVIDQKLLQSGWVLQDMKQLNLFTGLNTAVREVKKDERYRNAMQFSNIQNARDESDRATWEAILCNMSSGMELYTAYQKDIHSRRNQTFRDWLLDLIFNATYEKPSTGAPEKKIYEYSAHEPPFSMVAGDTVPYNVTNDD